MPASRMSAPQRSAPSDSVFQSLSSSPPSAIFSAAAAPFFSISRGGRDTKKAGQIMNTSFTMLCAGALVLMAAGLLFAAPILKLFGASDAALPYAYPYLMIYLLGTLPSMSATGMNPFINAQGYSVAGMLSVAIGAVTNFLLDPLFIFVFHLGITGAALATVLSQTLSALYVIRFLHRRAESQVRLQARLSGNPVWSKQKTL